MNKSILVVDDSATMRNKLRDYLEMGPFTVCAEATNGKEAIELALKHRPDLIVLDFSMPVMDGLTTARELKKLMPDVPIILFTQFGDFHDRLYGAKEVVDRVVSKSSPNELLESIRSLLPT
jgi:CheY-like chemotaxis protein